MANTYFKILNNSTKEKFTQGIINECQKDLYEQSRFLQNDVDDIYNMLGGIQNRPNNKLDVNELLKCYLLKQLIKEEKSKEKELKLIDTNNPNIKVNTDNNKFYKLVDDKYVEANEIECVNNDGTYTSIETRETSSYRIKKIHDINNVVVSIQLINKDNKVETDFAMIAEILELKKIYTQKFKYAGYSTNSNDFVAGILNKLSTPIETTYYMDKTFNYYEWSRYKNAFVRNTKAEITSPLMVDYEFKQNGNIIRKEFTGV